MPSHLFICLWIDSNSTSNLGSHPQTKTALSALRILQMNQIRKEKIKLNANNEEDDNRVLTLSKS